MKSIRTMIQCALIAACSTLAVNANFATSSGQGVNSAEDKRAVATFGQRVASYVKLRNRIKSKIPKLSKESTPEQIAAFEKSFVDALRTARSSAKPGDLFTPEAAKFIRGMLKTEFTPAEKKEIRNVVLDAEVARAPLKVNYPYPDKSEFVEMPVKVLLRLPQLPKEVRYRYVGRNLFLVDTDNNLIVDYMTDALP
ncbi:MAG TPA: hypothetical protein VMS31_05465 [Pyrinomonadaceae bacterium]|nr:hypothetical protein [Pyrinomonadaceae bacterium]